MSMLVKTSSEVSPLLAFLPPIRLCRSTSIDCPHCENIEVGSYECARCKHFLDSVYDIEHTGKLINELPVGDARRYMAQYKGIVKCNYSLCNFESI